MKDIGIPEKKKKVDLSTPTALRLVSLLLCSPVLDQSLSIAWKEGGRGGGGWGIFEEFTLSGGVKIKLSRSAQKAMHAPTVSFL